jgi:hypothetical protein
MGRLLFLGIPFLLYSFPVGRLLFRGVLQLFNGLPLTSGIFFDLRKVVQEGIPPAATKTSTPPKQEKSSTISL